MKHQDETYLFYLPVTRISLIPDYNHVFIVQRSTRSSVVNNVNIVDEYIFVDEIDTILGD